jgi:hypothetical protein
MTALDDWTAAVVTALRLAHPGSPADYDQHIVLDLARDVAHGVMRPAAPLTTYLLGIAVGRGADPSAAAAIIAELAKAWPASTDAS